jgi:hypothetical protein
LWAEFGNEIPFDRKNLLKGFGKDACGHHHSAKGLVVLVKGSFLECVMTWPGYKERAS